MEQSTWSGVTGRSWPTFRGNAACDIVLVGGGLTGVTLAHMLTEKNVSVVLLEANTLGSGASSACTGMVTAGLTEVYGRIASSLGEGAAVLMAERTMDAVNGVCSLAKQLGQRVERSHFSLIALQEQDLRTLNAAARETQGLGVPMTESNDTGDCPVPLLSAWTLRDQALLQPLSYLHALAEKAASHGARIFEHSSVTFVSDTRVHTAAGFVDADYVVLATGSPLDVKSLRILSLLTQKTALLYKLSGLPRFFGSYVQAAAHPLTLRPVEEGALAVKILGAAGTNAAHRQMEILRHELDAYLPDASTSGIFTGQDVYSEDGMPLIGPVERKQSQVLMATGYSGWGLTGSYLAAKLLTERILGTAAPYAARFLPFRTYTGKAKVLLRGGSRPMAALLGNSLRLSAPRCPHMGCRMRFNHASGLWECPCHGSAFTILGQCVHSPTSDNAEVSILQRPKK